MDDDDDDDDDYDDDDLDGDADDCVVGSGVTIPAVGFARFQSGRCPGPLHSPNIQRNIAHVIEFVNYYHHAISMSWMMDRYGRQLTPPGS